MTTRKVTATEPWPFGVWEERWPKGGKSVTHNVVDLRNGDRRIICHTRDEAERARDIMNAGAEAEIADLLAEFAKNWE